MTCRFNILIIGQAGRIEYEAAIFAASLRAQDPEFSGRLIVAEPRPGPMWNADPSISVPVRGLLKDLGAEIRSFENKFFGQSYPYGNKIEALAVMPEREPFVFFDSDTLVTGALSSIPFDFDRPAASMRRSATWPEPALYGPGYTEIWKSLYDKFGLDFETSLDRAEPDEYWKRYLYFNAGWFFGSCPDRFGEFFTRYALAIRDDPPETLACQSLDPWLDQVALPLVIHALGGRRPGPELSGLDGDITCHYRALPLLYAREPDHVVELLERVTAPNRIKKVLKTYDPIKRMIFQKRGHKVRGLFDRSNLPRREQAIRNAIKRQGFWMR